MAPRRNGLLAIGLALSAGALGGCDSGGSARRIPVRTWEAELPGRAAPLEVTLPVHLDDKLPRASVDYVLRAPVDVPEDMRGRPLTLSVPHMTARADLTVDGASAVPIDASALDRSRATGPHRWRIAEDASRDGKIALELRVHHQNERGAWIDGSPELTTDPQGGVGAVHAFNTAAAMGALSSGVIVTFLYAVLFLSMHVKRRAAYGWFAVGATCGAAYPAFVLGLTQPVFGHYEAPFMTVALALGTVAAMHFARAYARAEAPSKAWWGVLAGVVVLSIVARDPFHSIAVMAGTVVAVTMASAIAQLAFVVRLRRAGQRTPLGLYAVAFGWPLAVLLGLPDIAAWLGQGEPAMGIRTACVGIMGMSLYQAIALSREHLIALSRADDLNEELGERVKLLQSKHREVELLNDELRRQIAARSRELAEKLAKMDDEESAAPPPVLCAGDVVEGRYKVVRQLGAGGMGAVYEVERATDAKHFALKALASVGDAHVRARFAREAQIAANVNHPNVVSIVDIDVAKSGYVFLVMELVEGGTTLHDVRRRHRDIAWTLGVLAQVAEGIDAVHAAGIVHRDLKPGNILLSRGEDGRRPLVKITDFGISSLQEGARTSSPSMVGSGLGARPTMVSLLPPSELAGAAPSFAPPDRMPAVRIAELEAHGQRAPMLLDLEYEPEAHADTAQLNAMTVREGAVERGKRRPDLPPPSGPKRTPSAPLTETGIIFGTPQYMAQELTAGTRNATRASDVFSLGIIAFELLTGKRPFVEAPVSAKLGGRLLSSAPPFQHMCPTLPPAVAKLLDRAMSHEPAERPSAHELAVALRETADKLTG